MKIDEVVSLNDVLRVSQYKKILKHIKPRVDVDIDFKTIKNNIVRDWRSGQRSRKHYEKLLKKLNLSLSKIIS